MFKGKEKESASAKKTSYHLKEASTCPVCSAKHNREELLSGGGRLIAGNLTRELRRLYKPSSKYGVVYPLAYSVQVCPQCLYSSFPKDFAKLNREEIPNIKKTTDHRKEIVNILFGKVDFNGERNLIFGIASHILAVDCYHFRESHVAPTIKTAISCLRIAWLFDDLSKEVDYRPYDKARDFYYVNATNYYSKTLDYMQSGKEPMDSVSYMLGPDTDHNWGYEGVLYLNSYLLKKKVNLATNSKEDKIQELEKAKKYLSKVYGTGRSNRDKPSPIVDMSKDLFDDLSGTLKEIRGV